jgi:hypothetical protein
MCGCGFAVAGSSRCRPPCQTRVCLSRSIEENLHAPLQLGPLERQCAGLATEVRELKQRHQEEMGEQATQHAAHVALVRPFRSPLRGIFASMPCARL